MVILLLIIIAAGVVAIAKALSSGGGAARATGRTIFVPVGQQPPVLAKEPEKNCPKCAEHVKKAATICRFCGHEFKATDTHNNKTVVITNIGQRKMDVIQELRRYTGLGHRQAFDLLGTCPTAVARDIPENTAVLMKGSLETAGATVSLQDSEASDWD